MFANTQMMGLDSGFPEIALTPSPGGPVPIPYPNISAPPNVESGGGLLGSIGGLFGGLNPLSFLSMMGGGEPDAPAPASRPQPTMMPSPAPGAQVAPSQTRVILMSP